MASRYYEFAEFLSSFASYSDDCFTGEEFAKYADMVNVCKIEHFIYQNGVLIKKQVPFLTDDNCEPGYVEDSQDVDEDVKCVIRIFFKAYSPSFSEQQDELFKIFITSVGLFLAYKYTTDAYYRLRYYDIDSGVPNYNFFIKHINRIIRNSDFNGLSCCYINIKHSSKINHFFGGEATGRMISDFSSKLNTFVGNQGNEFTVHIGGDNFAVIILSDRIDSLIKYLRGVKVSVKYKNDMYVNELTARAGIVALTAKHTDAHAVLAEASQAMSVARKYSKDAVVFNANLTGGSDVDATFASRLADALNDNKFIVYFQPVVSTDGDTVLFEAEALARWALDGNLTNPNDFIDAAVDCGLISKLDYLILTKTCCKIKEWISQGIEPVRITCNFSNLDLMDSNLADNIIDVIDRHGVDRKYIGIEFKEPTTVEELVTMRSTTDKLKDAGISIVIDDFGTGMSSVKVLQLLSIDTLKISPEKLSPDGGRDKAIFASLIDLCGRLGTSVVCKGIENTNQIDDLIDCGCNLFQSYLYDKPLSERFFTRRLEKPVYNR